MRSIPPPPWSRPPRRPDSPEAGQSLVEFCLVLMPLFLILLGIIQFGFIFNTYITVTSASREGARLGTVYRYDQDCTKNQNDAHRNEAIRKAVVASSSQLAGPAANFTTTAATGTGCTAAGGWTTSGTTFTNGDIVVTYLLPAGMADSNSRVGQQVTVQAAYHQDLVIPMIALFLPKDVNGRMNLTGIVTMVIGE